jgi:hypothetical protein
MKVDTMARIEIVPAIGQLGGTRVAFSPDGRFGFSATLAHPTRRGPSSNS